MFHIFEAALITCIDGRLHQRKDGRNYIAQYILSLGIDCDLITRAGGVQDLLRQAGRGSADSVIRDVDVAHRLHQVDSIICVNHQDCGAYNGFKFKSLDEELRRHSRDMKRTLKMFHLLFPKKWLTGSFAELKSETHDVFDIKKMFEYKPGRKSSLID